MVKIVGKNQSQSGISTLEILIALALIVLATSSVIALVFGGQSLWADSQISKEELAKANEMLESAKATARHNFASVNTITAFSDGIYTKQMEVINIDDLTKKVSVQVSCIHPTCDPKRDLSIALEAIVTDFQNGFFASTCAIDTTANWSNPKVVNTTPVDIEASSTLTSVYSIKGKTYITADSPSKSKSDFYIVNSSNPVTPVILGKLDTGPGLNAVSFRTPYAYVANSSINGQLQIIDTTNTASPALITTYKLPGAYSDNTTIGNSIAYSSGKIFLGTKKSQISEFHVIDVSSPNSPTELGSFEIGNTINAILVIGSYAYIATPNNEELWVLDISNPANIKKVSGYDATGGSGNGKSLSFWGPNLLLGRTLGSKELHVLNIQNPPPANLSSLGSQGINDSINVNLYRGNLAFLGTNTQLEIWNLTNLAAMTKVSTLTLPTASAGMGCDGPYLYIGTLGTNGKSDKDVLKIVGP